MVIQFFFIILRKFCDDRGVHAIQRSTQLRILKYHCLKRCISGTLTDSKQCAVDAGRAIQPCSRRVVDCLIEIIVSVEFDQFARHTGMCGKSVNDARDTSRYHGTWEIHAISHRVTDTHLDRDLILIHQFHEFQTERDHKTIDIRTRDVLQMAAWADPGLQTFTDDTQVQVHNFASRHLHLIENMIIRAADQDTGLTQSEIFYQLEILFARADPACNFRELISAFQTFIYRVAVFFTVKEKLTLTDLSFRSAKFMEIIVNRHDLLCRIRCSRLLSVTEGCVRDPDLLRHIMRHNTVIECNLRNLRIWKQISECIRLCYVCKLVKMLL